MMQELRLLKIVCDRAGLRLRPGRLPSAADWFADALLRRFRTTDIAIQRELVHAFLVGLKLRPEQLKYPRTLGEDPVFAMQ